MPSIAIRPLSNGRAILIVIVVSLLGLLARPVSASVPTVKLRGTSSVRDADNPARHAYHLQTTITFGSTSA